MLMALQENYRTSFIRNNRVKKMSSESDAVIKRATSGSRAIGSRPLTQRLRKITKIYLATNIQLKLTAPRTVLEFAIKIRYVLDS